MATVKLRAFEIVNTNINSSSSDVGDKLRIYLDNSKDANERRMLLNSRRLVPLKKRCSKKITKIGRASCRERV